MIIKYILIIIIFSISVLIGNSVAGKYKGRVLELKEFKSALNLLKAKIRYTYEPIPEIFSEISNKFENNVGEIFKISKEKMSGNTAGTVWEEVIEEYKFLNISREDRKILKGMGKLLGKTDKNGQISEIELTEQFLDKQIESAECERTKNEKLYKTLGGIVGATLVIILIWKL